MGSRAYDFARGEHGFQTEYPIFGYSVFHGTGTACILRQISADKTGATAAWIGWVIEPFFDTGLLQHLSDYSRLYHHLLIQLIHFQNPVESFHTQYHASVYGQGPSAQARSRTSGCNGYMMGVAVFQDAGNLFGIFGLQHHLWQKAEIFRLIRAIAF